MSVLQVQPMTAAVWEATGCLLPFEASFADIESCILCLCCPQAAGFTVFHWLQRNEPSTCNCPYRRTSSEQPQQEWLIPTGFQETRNQSSVFLTSSVRKHLVGPHQGAGASWCAGVRHGSKRVPKRKGQSISLRPRHWCLQTGMAAKEVGRVQ